jgi:hypothetical protein
MHASVKKTLKSLFCWSHNKNKNSKQNNLENGDFLAGFNMNSLDQDENDDGNKEEEEENENIFFIAENQTKIQIDAGLNKNNRLKNEDAGSALNSKLRPKHQSSNGFFTLYFKRYKSFVTSPRVHFVFDAFFFITFLVLFSYMILCKFNFYDTEEIRSPYFSLNRSTTNSTNYKIETEYSMIAAPNFLEYLILFWVVSIIIEEIRQVI